MEPFKESKLVKHSISSLCELKIIHKRFDYLLSGTSNWNSFPESDSSKDFEESPAEKEMREYLQYHQEMRTQKIAKQLDDFIEQERENWLASELDSDQEELDSNDF